MTPAGEAAAAEVRNRTKATVKVVFWLLASCALIYYLVQSYVSGQMVRWYYYRASVDGYAVNADSFAAATKSKPALLAIEAVGSIEGLKAVPVKAGDRLPDHANGVISTKDLKSGKKATLDPKTNTIRVVVPVQIKESKGFKYKDSFKHKGIHTNPWAGLWNVAMVLGLGFCLGLLAEGITDLAGVKIEKIDHGIAH